MVKRSGDRKSAGGRGGRSGGDGDDGRENDDHFPKIALRVPKCAMEAQQMMGVVVMLVTFINFYFQEQIRRASPLPEAFFGVLPGGMPVLPSNFPCAMPSPFIFHGGSSSSSCGGPLVPCTAPTLPVASRGRGRGKAGAPLPTPMPKLPGKGDGKGAKGGKDDDGKGGPDGGPGGGPDGGPDGGPGGPDGGPDVEDPGGGHDGGPDGGPNVEGPGESHDGGTDACGTKRKFDEA